jgi:outer membrane protein
MKKISLLIIAAVFIGLTGQQLNAQELKFGHIDRSEFIQSLPEFDTAVANLEKLSRELSNQFEIMQVELNNKGYEYERDNANWVDAVRDAKANEIMDMNRRLQEFQQTAEQQLQEKQAEYFQPIIAKADKAIQDVGRENGFIYVFVVGQETSIGYFDAAKSVDIMPLVKTKLGIR